MDGAFMAPTEAGHAMNQLAAAGTDVTGGWSAASAAIAAAVGQVGKGVLGQAFLQGYQAHADEVAAAANSCTQVPGQFAVTGNQCVANYETTDANNARLFL